MTDQQTQVQPTTRNPASEHFITIRDNLNARREEITNILRGTPITVDRFIRDVETVITQNPRLLQCSPRAVCMEVMKAAIDGLRPDGREGAIIPRKNWQASKAAGHDIFECQWQPMVYGIIKKVRQSGEVSTLKAFCVYGGDRYRHWIDENGEHLEYEAGEDQDRSMFRYAVAFAKMSDGGIEIEALTAGDVEKIRQSSTSKDKGPWKDWWEEMAKKSAIRRLAKRLPMSSEIESVLTRDDERPAVAQIQTQERPNLDRRLEMLAIENEADPETGEITDTELAAAELLPADAQPEGAEVASHTSAPSEADPEAARLYDAAIALATSKGRAGFDPWFNRLRPEQVDLLKPHMTEIMAIAREWKK